MKVIALTGGIGSGKSVVSAVLRTMGYAVYDCDSRAKSIMDNSQAIKHSLVEAFGNEAVSTDGVINRGYIAGRVFGDDEALCRLNGIVHPAVHADVERWIGECAGRGQQRVFVETAILRRSNLHDIIDCEWRVVAPESVRVERVMRRNNLPREAVEARINAQAGEEASDSNASMIINDGIMAVLPQVERLLEVK